MEAMTELARQLSDPVLAVALTATNLAVLLLRKWKGATIAQQVLVFLMGILGVAVYFVGALRH